MTTTVNSEIETFMKGLERRNPGEREFHQAVREFVSICPMCLRTVATAMKKFSNASPSPIASLFFA